LPIFCSRVIRFDERKENMTIKKQFDDALEVVVLAYAAFVERRHGGLLPRRVLAP
jgi:hypothetical protein